MSLVVRIVISKRHAFLQSYGKYVFAAVFAKTIGAGGGNFFRVQ